MRSGQARCDRLSPGVKRSPAVPRRRLRSMSWSGQTLIAPSTLEVVLIHLRGRDVMTISYPSADLAQTRFALSPLGHLVHAESWTPCTRWPSGESANLVAPGGTQR